jgi:hypothetical protein
MESMEVLEIPDCVLPVKKENVAYGYFFSDYVVIENNLYLASCDCNALLCFNMDTLQYKWVTVGQGDNKFVGVTRVADKLWFAPRRNSSIVSYDMKTAEVIEYPLPNNFSDEYNFLGISAKGDLYLPGVKDENTWIFSLKDHKLHCVPNVAGHTFSGWVNENIYVNYFKDGTIVIEDGKIEKKISSVVTDNEFEDYFEIMKKDGRFVKCALRENNGCNLDMFIKLI